MRLLVRAGREEQRVRRAGGGAVAEADAPQPVDLDRPVVGALHDAVLLPAVLAIAERVDPAVPEVADQQVTAELAEVRRSYGQAPRRVELAGRRDPLDEVAAGVEGAHVAEALARDLFVGVLVLLGVGDVDLAADRLDAERRVALGQGRVGERRPADRPGPTCRRTRRRCRRGSWPRRGSSRLPTLPIARPR